jgi:hypothetical protein
MARGEAFSLIVRLSGVIPDRMLFVMALDDASKVEQSYALTPQSDGAETVAIKLEPARVQRTFRYLVSANDANTGWRRVQVSVPPHLAPLDGRPSPQIRLAYPNYTDLQPSELPDGAGAMQVVFGTVAHVRAATDRNIVHAAVQFRPGDARITAALGCMALADTGVSCVISTIPAASTLLSPMSVTVSATGTELSGGFSPILSGTHDLTFTDDAGLVGRWPIDVRVLPDPSPTVLLEEPTSANSELAPNSTLRIRVNVEDVTFAIRNVKIEYRTQANESPRYLPLYDGPPLESALASLLNAVAAPALKLRPTRMQLEQRLSLSMFLHADGKALAIGDQLTISVVATDFDDVSPTKPWGRSSEIELRIVAPDRLSIGQQLARQSLAKSLQELLALQTEALGLSQQAEVQRRATGELRPEDREQLARSESLQQRIQERLGDGRDAIRAEATRLRKQVADNPNASVSDQARADRLINELDRLAREIIEPIGPLLSGARDETGAVAANERSGGPLPEAVRHQRDAERSIRGLLADVESGRETAALAAEAGAIAAEQDKLSRQRNELTRAIPPGVAPQLLKEDQRKSLSQAQEAQEQLGQRAGDFARQLDAQANALRSTAEQELNRAKELEQKAEGLIPSAANDLRRQASRSRDKAERLTSEADAADAARKAAQGNNAANDSTTIQEKMKQAAQALGQNQLGAADERQQAATRQLDRILNQLREPSRPDGERLMKDRHEAVQQVDQLIRDQESLQDKTLAAEKQPDRQQQLEQLSREQEQLAERARELAEDRRNRGQSSAARDLDQASKNMDRAAEQLARGESASSKQDDALDRLDDAAAQVKRDDRELSEQLRREALVKVHDRIQGLAQRQTSLDAETERIFQAAKQAGSWSRSLQKSLVDLGRVEQELAQEINQAADHHLKQHKILHRLAMQASSALSEINSAIESARERGLNTDSLDNDRDAIRGPQQLAARRLSQLLEVLQPPKDKSADGATPGGNTSNESGGDRPAPESDLIPPDAQLKVLRQLQGELKDRVDEFLKGHADPAMWTDADRAKLDALRRDQAELVQLFTELAPDEQPRPSEKK